MARQIVEQVSNLVIYDDGTILFKDVRFSYVHVDKPWAKNPAKETPKFSVTGMLPKKTHKAAREKAWAYINDMLRERRVKGMASKDKFLRDGDDHKNPEYDGHWTVSASEVNRPSVRGPDAKPIKDPAKILKMVKSGYWGDILVRPWYQNNDHGEKINAGLVAVQVKRKDKVFGNQINLSEEDYEETFEASEDWSDDDDDSGFDDDDDGEESAGFDDDDDDEFGGL